MNSTGLSVVRSSHKPWNWPLLLEPDEDLDQAVDLATAHVALVPEPH
jgi:hypothetical protein